MDGGNVSLALCKFQYIREHKNLVLDPKYLFITSLDLIIAKMTLKKTYVLVRSHAHPATGKRIT